MIERQVQHMTRLVDDLLDVSRITRGKIELRKELVDLASVVSRTVEASRPLIEDRRHELTVDAARPSRCAWRPTRPGWNRSWPTCSTTPPSTPTTGGHIWLTAGQEGGEVVLRGEGHRHRALRPDMLARIFEPVRAGGSGAATGPKAAWGSA